MNTKLFATLFLGASLIFAADFSYTEKTEVTGGSMKSMMGMAARFGGQSGPTTTVHRYQGDRMASQSGKTGTIMDAVSETMTSIDYDKKEYSTITFAEMAAAMKQAQARAAGSKSNSNPQMNMNFKISADNTGKTRMVNGVNANEHIIKVTMETQDQKSGNSGAMDVVIDSWFGQVPGSEAVRDFNKRLAAKMAAGTPMGGAAMAMMGGMNMSGMAEAQKKMADMEGMSLYSVTKLGPTGMAAASQGSSAPPQPQQPQAQQQQQPSASETASTSALGRLGRLGRLGGRGNQEQKNSQPAAQQAPSGGQAPAASDGAMLETTTEVVSWSAAPIDAALMQVPAGFKQVEHPLKKQLK